MSLSAITIALMSPGVINYDALDMTRWKPDAAGRLMKAAMALFEEQGYEQTTVAEIAERAGLTKRTFFRYFADKREVLFAGGPELEHLWVQAARAAPPDAAPLAAVTAGFGPLGELFEERHEFARARAQIVDANPELRERELIKLQALAAALADALRDRGASSNEAILASQAGVTVFHVGFARWVAQDDPGAFRRLLDESLAELRAVAA